MHLTKTTKTLLITLFMATLTACGSSSSTSGPDSSNPPSSSNSNAEVFNGSATITLTTDVPGVDPQTDTGPITITDNQGTITVSSGEESGTGTRNGNAYSVPVKLAVTDSGISCEGNLVFNGTINGETTSGSVTGSIPCSGVVSGTITANGEFSASK